jgi:hypothetical protein
MTFRRPLPAPSSKHATCPWCRYEAPSIVELLEHVELHVGGSAVDGRDVA